MIVAVHNLIYSKDADADRVFLRDVLGLGPHVEDHPGWLIFKSPPAELAVHPLPADQQERHEVSLICDDVEATVAELRAKGVTLSDVNDEGYGLVSMLQLPGGGRLQLYEPKHQVAYDK